MSDFTGPGRKSEMSTMRSSNCRGPSLPMSSALTGTLDLEHPQGAGRVDEFEGRGVVVGHLGLVVEVDPLPGDPFDLGDGMGHGGLHPDAEDVEP